MNMKRKTLALGVVAFLTPLLLGAQPSQDRIDSALSRAENAGIPLVLLESKVQEGRAKGIPLERIADAVEARLDGLSRAAAAMEGIPEGPDVAQLSLGADALGAGVSEAVLAELVAGAPEEHRAVAIAALTHLVQQGTVPDVALARVQDAMARGPGALADLPGPGGPPFGTPVPSQPGPPAGVEPGPPSSIPGPGQGGPPDSPGGGGPPTDLPTGPPGGGGPPSGGGPTGGPPTPPGGPAVGGS